MKALYKGVVLEGEVNEVAAVLKELIDSVPTEKISYTFNMPPVAPLDLEKLVKEAKASLFKQGGFY